MDHDIQTYQPDDAPNWLRHAAQPRFGKTLSPRSFERLAEPISADAETWLQEGDDTRRPMGAHNQRFADIGQLLNTVIREALLAGNHPQAVAELLLNPNYRGNASILAQVSPQARAVAIVRAAYFLLNTPFRDLDADARPLKTLRNSLKAVQTLGLTLGYNEFTCRKVIDGPLLGNLAGQVTDDVLRMVRHQIIDTFDFDPGAQNLRDAVETLCLENRYNPILSYFEKLEWDGVPRLETLLIEYCGAADTPLIRAFSARFLVAAVRRVKRPGCKFDTVLVLEGAQGTGKSTFLSVLAGEESRTPSLWTVSRGPSAVVHFRWDDK